jgi:hypothetical protein
MEAKKSFELFDQSHGVTIQQYHADNGRFAERKWIEDVQRKVQILTFAGVVAHHQNGKAEKRVRDLHDMARTSLIHAYRMLPDAINVHLWPYALRHANEAINMTTFKDFICTPLEKFSDTKIRPNYRNIHIFGCPAYVLDGSIQSSLKGGKWSSRARIAIYLGTSPNHARSVGLVLSLTTGLVSPQYHIKCDDTFETLPQARTPKSVWQNLSGFLNTGTGKTRTIVPTTSTEIPISEHKDINSHLMEYVENASASTIEGVTSQNTNTDFNFDDIEMHNSESVDIEEEIYEGQSENDSENENESAEVSSPKMDNDHYSIG